MKTKSNKQVPVELQLSFRAPITSAEDNRKKQEKGKLKLMKAGKGIS